MNRWESDPILAVEHLTMRFGGLVAVNDLSFFVGRGDITALIGPTAPARRPSSTASPASTSRPRAASRWRIAPRQFDGLAAATEHGAWTGSAKGDSTCSSACPRHEIAKHARVARTFQNIRLFGGMTVLENLMVAQHNKLMRPPATRSAGIFGLASYRAGHQAAIDKALYWLEQVDLVDRADDPASSLPYGAQRRLEIVRAMCTDPLLLCLDEPAAGLNPREVGRTQQAPPLHPRRARYLRPAHRTRHGRGHGNFGPHRRARLRREDFGRLRRFRPQRRPSVIAAYLGVDDEEVEKVEEEVSQ